MRNKIQWRLWYNPFGDGDMDDLDSIDEFMDEDEANEKTPWELREEEQYEGKSRSMKIRPVVPTPMGFMPVQPYQSFVKAFQFWMADTNFDITQEVKDKIEETPGVEILDVLTRYSFRIAIGKVFNGGEVKHQIMKTLNALPPRKGEINPHDMKLDDETEGKLNLLQKTLKDKYPYWVIYVLPNGEIDFSGSTTADGFQTHLNVYKQCQDLAGGVIYQYA